MLFIPRLAVWPPISVASKAAEAAEAVLQVEAAALLVTTAAAAPALLVALARGLRVRPRG